VRQRQDQKEPSPRVALPQNLTAARRAAPSRSPPRSARSSTTGRSRVPGAGKADGLVRHGLLLGVERLFWQLPGVWVTAVGYMGGATPNPTYREVCGGMTGHAEAVQVVFDPRLVSYEALLKVFWEGHDPTQGMRQGNDVGSQYRSAIYTAGEEQAREAVASEGAYQQALTAAGKGAITTDDRFGGEFLLRRRLPPAVPGQEPGRLLRARRHGRFPARSAPAPWREPAGVRRRLPSPAAVTSVVQWAPTTSTRSAAGYSAVAGPGGSCSFKATDIALRALTETGRARPRPTSPAPNGCASTTVGR